MTQTREKPKIPEFVIVYGGPRTGTSLVMDIVVMAQYNLGKCYTPPNPRRGRNEHPLFGQPLKRFKSEKVWKQIEKEDINCAKIIGYPDWISRMDGLSVRPF